MFIMINTGFSGKIVLSCIMILSVTYCIAQFGGGEGTLDDPYIISRPEHLNSIRDHLEAHFLQTDDINLGGEWSEGEGWQPIGSFEDPFSGTYHGNGFFITNLTIDREANHQGLFARTRDAGIRNVTLINIDINAGDNVGGIAGLALNTNIIECYVQGTISGTDQLGGIAGFTASGTNVVRCVTLGSITGSSEVSFIGGISGVNFDESRILDSYSKMTVSGNQQMIGGLVGWNFMGTINRCYSTGAVSAAAQNPTDIGGLLGNDAMLMGIIFDCYWDTGTSGRNSSAGGEPRNTEQMTYPYADNVYLNWNFDDVWIGDEDHNYNNGYPLLRYLLEQMVFIEPPELNIVIETGEDIDRVVITWEAVEDARSYLVYASFDPYADDWGEAISILRTEETRFSEPVNEAGTGYYRVVASTLEPPE